MIDVLLVPADNAQPLEKLTIEPTLNEFRKLIGGGWLETISLDGKWRALFDEEGKFKGFPMNQRATTLLETLGWLFLPFDYIAGDAIILGEDGSPLESSVLPETLAIATTLSGIGGWVSNL